MGTELSKEGEMPKKKWFLRAAKDSTIGASVGAIGAIPIAGPIIVGIIQEMRSTYAQQKAEEALSAVRAELVEQIDRLDGETAAKIETYVNESEFVNAVLYPAFEAVVRAQGQAKVDAAIGFSVNSAMMQGKGNPALREFVAAFLRDATVLDIRALLKVPKAGARIDPRKIDREVMGPHLDNFFNELSLSLELNAPEIGLAEGTIGRLSMLGLIVAQTGSNKRLCPIQRTALGDSVVELITR